MDAGLKDKDVRPDQGLLRPKRRVRVLLFDVMDTLVYDPFRVELPAFFEATLEELLRVKHPTAWPDFEKNRISEERFAEVFFRDGRAFDYPRLKKTLRQAYRWIDGMEDLLRDVKTMGVEMHALSNYPVWWQMIEDKLKLSRYLDWTFLSCKTGLRKPDPQVYIEAAKELGRDPSEIAFIDDRISNCRSAQRVGMLSHHFEDAATLRAYLGISQVEK